MRYSRKNDRWRPGGEAQGPPRLDPVIGTWFNCDARTGEIVRLELLERGGALALRAYGADEPSPADWGETRAAPHVSGLGSREVTGFTAEYDFGFMETSIAANIKYGVLVIQSYNRFNDDSGRPCYFSREFFHQVVGRPASPPADPEADLPSRMVGDRLPRGASGAGGGVDLGPLLGRWRNTNRDSKGIASVVLSREGGIDHVEGSGVGDDRGWGRVAAIPHATNVASREPAGFLARYDFGFSEVVLSANEAKGLLIIASFTTFRDDSGRSPYFTREFFYREAGGGNPAT